MPKGEILAALGAGAAACGVAYLTHGGQGVAWTLLGMSIGVLLLALWTACEG
jgi:hypothetical protein